MKYAIWWVPYNEWIGWTFSERLADIKAPYTNINDAYRNKEYWWPISYKDFEVREISEEEIQLIQKERNQ